MIRLITVFVLAILFVSSKAHYVSDIWEAKISDSACFIATRTGHRDPNYEAIVSLITPHPDAPDIYAELAEFDVQPVFLQVQITPNMFIRDEVVVSSAAVHFADQSKSLVLDPTWTEDSLPLFVLSAAETKQIWEHVARAGSLTVSVAIDEQGTTRLPVPSENIEIAIAMHSACVSKVIEQHRK